jgi:hypothetical protein
MKDISLAFQRTIQKCFKESIYCAEYAFDKLMDSFEKVLID